MANISISSPTPISQDFQIAISRGQIPGSELFEGFGARIASGAVTNGIIWPNGSFYIPAASGVQPQIVSTSAQDGVGGTGLLTVEIHYLDNNLIQRHETITMNGITPVVMVATNVRFIQDTHGLTAGSGKAAAGIITTSFSGNAMSIIDVGFIRARSTARMVPSGKVAFVNEIVGGSTSGTSAASGRIEIMATQLDTNTTTASGLFYAYGSLSVQDNSATAKMYPPLKFTEGVIIAMAFTIDKAATVTGSWFGWIENA